MDQPYSDALVFFGATGDLAYKQIFPSLQKMAAKGKLAGPVIGVAKAGWNLDKLKARAKDSVEKHGGMDPKLASRCSWKSCAMSTATTWTRRPSPMSARNWARRNIPFTISLFRPVLFGHVLQQLKASGSADGARVVIEKPFGHDLQSAIDLNKVVHETFAEEDVFPHRSLSRQEHSAERDLLSVSPTHSSSQSGTTSTSRAYKSRWRSSSTSSDRGSFYDVVGAVRDVVQNHLLQLLCNIAMEPPPTLSIESLRDERVKVLKSVQELTESDIVRGQYAGYLDTPGVKKDSTTETFVAMHLTINSWRWRGVPFFIRAGKSLPLTETEVVAKLKAPCPIFADYPPPANYVRFRISGQPVIAIGASIKTAGDHLVGCPIELVADQECGADDMLPYEELLGDAMAGIQTWFAREDQVEEAWRIIDPILNSKKVEPYAVGSWGPADAAKLVAKVGGWSDPK